VKNRCKKIAEDLKVKLNWASVRQWVRQNKSYFFLFLY
jgi:hypothetical protein